MRKNMREIKRKEGGGAGKGKREGKERKGNRRGHRKGIGSNYERLGRRMALGF